jgi:hypothetical protein
MIQRAREDDRDRHRKFMMSSNYIRTLRKEGREKICSRYLVAFYPLIHP